jgi:selenium metabolism protein YedF
MRIDARGMDCPKPVMMAEEALSKISEGIIEVLVDNEGSAKNLAKFARTNSFYSETLQEDNYWRVKIVKGYPCEVHAEEPARETEKGLFMVVATDTMGKEEALGKILVKGFFETMKVYRELPSKMFFVNTGVKLTTINEETVALLKEFDAMGVEIFSCGTCLKYFDLESELKVGFRGGTTNILEGMSDCRKTVWIG